MPFWMLISDFLHDLKMNKNPHCDKNAVGHSCILKKNLRIGLPKGLQDDLKRGFEVSTGNKNLSKSIKEAASELISIDDTLLHFN